MFKGLKFPFIFLILIALFIFFHYLKILSPVENVILNIIVPVQERIYNLKHQFNQLVCSKDNNVEELISEVNRLTVLNAKLRLLEEENQILKKELKFFENNSYNFVAARIIGKDSTASDTFILNKGSRDGIKVGLPVVIDEGILVGKIVKVEEGISNFLLLTDNNSKVAAAVLQNNMDFSKTNGIVTGEHGLSMKMEFIPKDVNLGEGDIVITSGLEKDIPRGLVIGKIDRVINEEGLVFQSAIVKQMARVDDLSIVSILLP